MASQTVLCLSTLFTNCKTPLTELKKIFSFHGSKITFEQEKQFSKKNTQTKLKADEFMLTCVKFSDMKFQFEGHFITMFKSFNSKMTDLRKV